MPWDASDAQGHTSHANTDKKRRQWAHIANGALKAGHSEASAIRQANAAVHKMVSLSDEIEDHKEAVDRAARRVLDYLKANNPEVLEMLGKNMTAGDAHVSTALGNQPGSKKMSFAEALAVAKKPKKIADEAPTTVAVKADFPLRITKIDADQQKVFGWAYISERAGQLVVDKQNDAILPADLELAAHDFALHWRSQGDMHKLGDDGMPLQHGRMIESMVFTAEKRLNGLKAVDPDTGDELYGWFVGFKVDDPTLWEAHKRGERPEFSIGGRGRRVELEINE